MKSVAVFCGSSFGTDPAFKAAAETLGHALADRDITLIYGGSKLGLMKPVGVLNTSGYYDSLTVFLDGMMDKGFITSSWKDNLTVAETVPSLLETLAAAYGGNETRRGRRPTQMSRKDTIHVCSETIPDISHYRDNAHRRLR